MVPTLWEGATAVKIDPIMFFHCRYFYIDVVIELGLKKLFVLQFRYKLLMYVDAWQLCVCLCPPPFREIFRQLYAVLGILRDPANHPEACFVRSFDWLCSA